ncbi:MFS transporter [Streptomyces sp. NPDC102381]|uniref:MFS transporter n=1 Tax=Streptomyces sp. NPDC102381 TaxID=3366164 RepID=UPI003821EDDA
MAYEEMMTTGSGRPAGSKTQRRVLLAVSLGVFSILFEGFALNLALPHVGSELGADGRSLQWIVSAYLLAAGPLMLGAGRLGDQLGRRRMWVLGMLIFGAASMVCALAPSLPVLVAARVVQGAGGALVIPTGLALLTNAYPVESRGRATGWALGAGGVAMAISPLVGGVLTTTTSWRAVFWINVPCAVLGAVMGTRAEESRGPSTRTRIDWLGLFAGTASLLVITALVDRAGEWGWVSVRSAVAIALSVLLLVAFLYIEKSVEVPLVRPQLLRNIHFVALTVSGAAVNTATVILLLVIPLSLQAQWGLSASGAGLGFVGPALALAVTGPLAGRVSTRKALPLMASCLGTGAALLVALVAAPNLVAYLVISIFCVGIFGAANATTLIATQAVVTPQQAGEASGVTKTIVTVAAGLGVALASSGTSSSEITILPARTILLVTALCCMCACLALFAWVGLSPHCGGGHDRRV